MSGKSTGNYTHSCRACLGAGCVHCSNHGQVRERVFRRRDAEAEKLRALIAGKVEERLNPEWARAEWQALLGGAR